MAIAPTLNVPPGSFSGYAAEVQSLCSWFWIRKDMGWLRWNMQRVLGVPQNKPGLLCPDLSSDPRYLLPHGGRSCSRLGTGKSKIVESNKEVHFYSGRQYRGTTICRSMEKPDTIVGFKIGNALVDELDVLKADKARQAWRKIIARMRYKVDGLRNGIDVTTTPEGFKFVYNQFVKAVREKPELRSMYGLVTGFDIRQRKEPAG
ncbi:Uncharacterised protein [Klebsiella pneumoniae]|uniref:Uncharacterized protein n=1 Tax=Klebsiella pneumoniae TaxID=573 RepID=A0A2X3F002_KLEPN|nr:Uncharacterised protein [Klebsiella pneumoniae]